MNKPNEVEIKVPIISGSNKLIKVVADVMDENGVLFNWLVFSPKFGILEPQSEAHHDKFEEIVQDLIYRNPSLFNQKRTGKNVSK